MAAEEAAEDLATVVVVAEVDLAAEAVTVVVVAASAVVAVVETVADAEDVEAVEAAEVVSVPRHQLPRLCLTSDSQASSSQEERMMSLLPRTLSQERVSTVRSASVCPTHRAKRTTRSSTEPGTHSDLSSPLESSEVSEAST